MTKIQFLTSKVFTPNTHAIIYPILKWKKYINNDVGEFKIKKGKIEKNSDIIILDSKFHKNWWLDKSLGKKAIFDDIKNLKKRCNKLVYYDTTDSTGCIQKEVFNLIDQYWKGQTLFNKNKYKKIYHSGRIFTEYFKNKYFPEKSSKYDWEKMEEADIKKIRTAWNSSLTDYRYLKRGLARIAAQYDLSLLMGNNIEIEKYKNSRKFEISCRIFSNYQSKVISWQREKAKKLLSKICDTECISKRKYHKELLNSRITFSPFGWGEICYRDFEAIYSGSLLLKPSMSHVETWPDLYLENKTYLPCDWDLENLINIINNFDQTKANEITENARKLYSSHLNNNSGVHQFTKRLKFLIKDLITS